MRPTQDLVLVRSTTQEKTAGGIHIPDTARTAQEGVVVAVGPGRVTETAQLIEPRVKVGDKVTISRAQHEQITVPREADTVMAGMNPGEKLLLMREEHILLIH